MLNMNKIPNYPCDKQYFFCIKWIRDAINKKTVKIANSISLKGKLDFFIHIYTRTHTYRRSNNRIMIQLLIYQFEALLQIPR